MLGEMIHDDLALSINVPMADSDSSNLSEILVCVLNGIGKRVENQYQYTYYCHYLKLK